MAEVQARRDLVECRLATVEQSAGTGPDTSDLGEQIDRFRHERRAAADAQTGAALRDR